MSHKKPQGKVRDAKMKHKALKLYCYAIFLCLCSCSASPRSFGSLELDADVDTVAEGGDSLVGPSQDSAPKDSRSTTDSLRVDSTPPVQESALEADTQQAIQVGTLAPTMLNMNDLNQWSFGSVNGSVPLSTPEWNGGSGEFSWTSPMYTAGRSFNFTFVVGPNASLPCEVWLTVGGFETNHQTSSEKKTLAFYVPVYQAGPVRITLHMKSAGSCFYQAHGWS